ncbi:50S ribosomal protein L15 [bacterium]|nr:50S ribosomal protein L15 [bacterium]
MDYSDLVKTTRRRIRVGRGKAGRRGKTAGRGMKGAKARTGYHPPPMYEGGALPLHRRVPRLGGFTSRNQLVFQPVNVGALERFDEGAQVTVADLVAAGLVRGGRPVKLLARGEITKKITIEVDRASAAARAKIEAAGGSVRLA